MTSLRSRVESRLWIERRRLQLLSWKAKVAMTPKGDSVAVGTQTKALQNKLPNSGPIKIDPAMNSARVLSSVVDGNHRKTDVSGFEGLALDDALAYSDEYKHFSFFREAKAVASIARSEFGRTDASVLELGCGGGDLGYFLKMLGVREYIGVDANPVAYNESPYIGAHKDHFRLLNLQEEIDFGSRFDIVCTFEMLEHIREDKLPALMRTIRNHMDERSLFLGTASLQEQYDVHITVKPRPFWLDMFASVGLEPHPRAAEYEGLLSRNNPFNWDASNTNVFALRVRKSS
jgi:2-polyprenyl-3-methyl-5-hydroxy-6-metoxy-1,4-benzoquinol methylase